MTRRRRGGSMKRANRARRAATLLLVATALVELPGSLRAEILLPHDAMRSLHGRIDPLAAQHPNGIWRGVPESSAGIVFGYHPDVFGLDGARGVEFFRYERPEFGVATASGVRIDFGGEHRGCKVAAAITMWNGIRPLTRRTVVTSEGAVKHYLRLSAASNGACSGQSPAKHERTIGGQEIDADVIGWDVGRFSSLRPTELSAAQGAHELLRVVRDTFFEKIAPLLGLDTPPYAGSYVPGSGTVLAMHAMRLLHEATTEP